MFLWRLVLGLGFLYSVYGFGLDDVARFWAQIDETSLMIRGFSDPTTCYANLAVSDENEDGQLSQEEYITYAKLSGPSNFMLSIDEFEDLPLAFQSTFLALSCLCPESRKTNCCDNQINISGADGDANSGQSNDLFLVCSLTRVAVDQVLSTIPPSPSPTTETKTPQPTPAPTTIPPTTTAPSLSPTGAITPPPTIVEQGGGEGLPDLIIFDGGSEVPIGYRVGVAGGAYGTEYNDQLIGAMDALAPKILSDALGERRLGSLGLRRRLQSVALPTLVKEYLQDVCEAVLPSADGCANIQASVKLQFPPGFNNITGVSREFQVQLDNAISSGELQDNLETLYPETNLYIIDDDALMLAEDSDDEDEAALQGGGIAGLVVASAAFIVFFIAYLAAARRRRESKEDLENLPDAPKEQQRDLAFLNDEEANLDAPGGDFGTLGATTPDYGTKKKREDSAPADHESDAGDSGWSSSAGVSSLNTGDQTGDTGDDFGLDDDPATESAGATSIASIGAQQHQTLKSEEAAMSTGTPSSVTRSDLDTAIEAGDWAAVGATAALLAAASDSNSFSSRSLTGAGTSTRDGSTVSSYDAARAAELDNLVDAGDWEGVVLAAARYEAASTVASDSESRQTSDVASLASSVSRSRKQQELRAQVEDLVQLVVPEEIQNVDEMMLQFRGREEDLVETLRTMQERQIAKKAREGSQVAAKDEAKKQVTEKKSLFSFGGLKAASSKSLGTGKLTAQASQAKSLGTGTVETSKPLSGREKKQNTLEEAIEAGDWEAVGEAAAMLNDASSASSADTDEINRLADGLSSQGSVLSGSSAKRTQRAEELDKLIDKGDWMGVVQAAADFETEEDKQEEKKMKKTKSWFSRKQKKEEEDSKKQKKEEIDARREKRLKRLQEEQEALEQAEIWMAIAEKSKDDGDEDKGASDAADWAIGRSLAALVEAEGSGKLRDSYRSTNDSQNDSHSEDEV